MGFHLWYFSYRVFFLTFVVKYFSLMNNMLEYWYFLFFLNSPSYSWSSFHWWWWAQGLSSVKNRGLTKQRAWVYWCLITFFKVCYHGFFFHGIIVFIWMLLIATLSNCATYESKAWQIVDSRNGSSKKFFFFWPLLLWLIVLTKKHASCTFWVEPRQETP
jgi:hypothetical protein